MAVWTGLKKQMHDKFFHDADNDDNQVSMPW